MSISSEITRITGNISDAYTAVSGKGGTLPSARNSANLPEAIESIPSGITPSGNVQLTQQSGTDVTNYATASVRSGSVTLNTPTINSSTGVVTASASVGTSGWVGSAPSSKTLSLTTQAAKTVTPGTTEQTAVAAARYTTGAVKVAGDADLVAGNIKSGVNIFGVNGTLQPAKTEQSKTLTLGAAAPSTVTPDSGKVLSSVPVVLDTSVIKAANIAKGVTMLGIPGAHEGGGGGGETCTITVSGSQNLYICYTDENGNFINGETIQKGTSKTIPKRHFLAKGADSQFRGTLSGAKIYTATSNTISTTLNEVNFISSNAWNLFVPTSSTISVVASCFLSDTLITLADGTKKQIKDLTYSDSLKVWNFDTGEFDTAPICWLTRSGLYSDHYYKLTFSDGTILKTTGQNSNHKVYNVDERFFKGVDKTEIGDRIFSENGIVTVVNKEYIEEEVEYYNLITTGTINCFAEGILTSDRYGNLYPIDENMMYVKDGRYRPYEEFEAVGIKRYWYDTLRLAEVSGTIDETRAYIDKLECQMLPLPEEPQ